MLNPIVLAAPIPRNTGWTPSKLGSNLIAWWNANDHGAANMTDDGGGLISAWTDNVGGVSLTAATTARPTWTTGVVTFDGSANCLRGTSLGALPTGANESVLWFSATQTAAAASERMGFAYGAIGTTLRRDLEIDASNVLTASVGTTTDPFNSSAAGYHIMKGGFLPNGGNGMLTGRLDGIIQPSVLIGAALNTGTTRVSIGSYINTTASLFWTGAVYDAIVTTDLSQTQEMQLEGYLAWKAGNQTILPFGHPFRNSPP